MGVQVPPPTPLKPDSFIPTSEDAVLRRAADARGESANDFVVRNAVEAAEMKLAERRVFVVDDSAWEELQELFSRPPALPSAVVTLLSNPSVLERPVCAIRPVR